MTRYQRVNATESEVNPVVAVIRFFRAFDYFDKIKTFGDVPWYEKDLTTADIDELYKARDDRDFVLGKLSKIWNLQLNGYRKKCSRGRCFT